MEIGDRRELKAGRRPWEVCQVRTLTTGDEWKRETRIYKEKIWIPDNDISGESDEVKNLCNSTWTTEVKKLFEDSKK